MQALCQWDVQRDESAESFEDFFAAIDHPLSQEKAGSEVVDYARELVTGFWAEKASVDERLAAASPKWDLERMSLVERNGMRVAVLEMLGGKTPPRVALDEALEIVKEYGGADSPRFVNGVLDQVYRKIQTVRHEGTKARRHEGN